MSFTQAIEGIIFQDGLYVAVAHRVAVFLSQDGVNWEQQEAVTFASLYGVTSHRGKVVVVGSNGTILVGEKTE